MAVISRGFGSRRLESGPELPPGQYRTTDFPVLSAGPTPEIDTADWQFVIRDETGARHAWGWGDLLALPVEDIHTDIHCVTTGRSWAPRGAESPWTRCSPMSKPPTTTRWSTATAATPPTCRWPTCSTARRGSRSNSTV